MRQQWSDRLLGGPLDVHTYTLEVGCESAELWMNATAASNMEVTVYDADGVLVGTRDTMPNHLPLTGVGSTVTVEVRTTDNVCASYDLALELDCAPTCAMPAVPGQLRTRETALPLFPGVDETPTAYQGNYIRPLTGEEWYHFELCAFGQGNLVFQSDRDPSELLDLVLLHADGTVAATGHWIRQQFTWLYTIPLADLGSDVAQDLYLHVQPTGMTREEGLCTPYGLHSTTQIECGCPSVQLTQSGNGNLLTPLGAWIPYGRVSSDTPATTTVELCAGGTLTAAFASSDPTLQVLHDGVAIDASALPVTIEGDAENATTHRFEVTTAQACSLFELELIQDGCTCTATASRPPGLDNATPVQNWSSNASTTTFGVSGTDSHYARIDTLPTRCTDGMTLQIQTTPNSGAPPLSTGVRVLDANGVVLPGSLASTAYHIELQKIDVTTLALPLYLEYTGTHEATCESFQIRLSAQCMELRCDDDLDNDGNGQADCADSACSSVCRESCEDGIDNNNDGLTDCEDRATCGSYAHCMPQGPIVYEHFEHSPTTPGAFFDLHRKRIVFTPADTAAGYTWETFPTSEWRVAPGSSESPEYLTFTSETPVRTLELNRTLPFFTTEYDALMVGRTPLLLPGRHEESYASGILTGMGNFYNLRPQAIGLLDSYYYRDLQMADPETALVVDRFDDHIAITFNGVRQNRWMTTSNHLLSAQLVLHDDGRIEMVWLDVPYTSFATYVGLKDDRARLDDVNLQGPRVDFYAP